MLKTIVITGCSSGFGRSSALRFARRGDRVHATMRGIRGKNAEKAAELLTLAKSEGLALEVHELDVCDSHLRSLPCQQMGAGGLFRKFAL